MARLEGRKRRPWEPDDAAISWPLILPGDVSLRSMRPAPSPPLGRQATRSPVFNAFAMLSSEESSHPNAPGAIRLQGFTDRGGEFGFHVGSSSDVELREWRHAGAAEIQHGAASKFSCILFSKYGTCAIVVSVDKF
jgi:hypothetical protein